MSESELTPPAASPEAASPAPAAFEVHRSGVQPVEGGLNGYLWGSVVLIGALIGFGWFEYRIASEQKDSLHREPEASAGALPVAGGDAPTAPAGELRTRPDAGFSVRVPSSLRSKWLEAGVNRILQVSRGPQPLLAINSGPIYPWLELEDLASQIEGAWRTGDVDALGVRLGFKGQGWGLSGGKHPYLVLVEGGRIVKIMAKDWKAPEVREILATFRPRPGADWRSVYRRSFKIDAKTATGRPAPELLAQVDKRLIFLGKELAKYGTPVTLKGVRRYHAQKLDHLDTLILRDLLDPAIRAAQRARREANKPVPERYQRRRAAHGASGPAPRHPKTSPH